MTIPTMVTIKDAAGRTGLSYEFIRQLIREDKIKYVRAGKKFLINLEFFVEFLNSGDPAAQKG